MPRASVNILNYAHHNWRFQAKPTQIPFDARSELVFLFSVLNIELESIYMCMLIWGTNECSPKLEKYFYQCSFLAIKQTSLGSPFAGTYKVHTMKKWSYIFAQTHLLNLILCLLVHYSIGGFQLNARVSIQSMIRTSSRLSRRFLNLLANAREFNTNFVNTFATSFHRGRI